MTTAYVIVFGLIIGSFLSMCIYRIPAMRDDLDEPPFEEGENDAPIPARERGKGESQIKGINSPKRSLCFVCGGQLKWYHNIPVFSWMALGGKCAYCKTRISVRYPVVELLSALAAILSYNSFGLTAPGIIVYLFVCSLIVISFIDYDYYIIPNVISIPGFFIAIGIAVSNQLFGWLAPPIVPGLMMAFYGFLCGAGFLWAFAEMFRLLRGKEGLGMGDVKLLAMTGVLFGPQASIATIVLGSVFGSFLGITLMLFSGRSWAKPLPFGPYLAIGTVLYLFAGDQIFRWWFGSIEQFLS